MYQEHPAFTPPPREATLWRYMDFAKFVFLLDTSSLFFCRADRLQDPFEGSWAMSNFEAATRGVPQDIAERVRKGGPGPSVFGRMFLINCWHCNEFESDAMWKIYSAPSAGVAIKTDFGSLADAFTSKVPVNIGSVHYIDYETDKIPDQSPDGPFLRKRYHFEHEREVRAIVVSQLPLEEHDSGMSLPVDLSTLVHEVVVSPLAQNWLAELVKSVATKYGLAAPVIASSLADGPSWG